MKNLKTLSRMLFIILACALTLPTYSQGVAIYKKDGTIVKYSYEEIDSIVTYNYGETPETPIIPDTPVPPTICKINVESNGEGAVSVTNYIGTSANVLIGNQVEVVATPATGNAFIGWYLSNSNTPVSTDARFIFTASENTTLIAKFSRLSNITVCSAGNGRVSFKESANSSLALLPGTEVTVVATPNADCDFIGWFVGDAETPISTDAEYTLTVPEENITLTAKFSKRPVVTIRSAGYGSVSFKGLAESSLALLPGTEVTVVATPDAGYDFIGWFVGDEETPVSISAEYTFKVVEDLTLIAKFKAQIVAIDLGLPSGIKWANMNVGAISPEEYGGYYAWGETEEQEDYDFSTYKWSHGSGGRITKYCTDSYDGTVDNKTTLDLEDDVANVKWGGSWRMPTFDEQKELLNKCTWTWTIFNGVNGYTVTGPNGNSIFLPAAGNRAVTVLYNSGSYGNYWSSSLCEGDNYYAYSLNFCSSYSSWSDYFRYRGHSVRPVCE